MKVKEGFVMRKMGGQAVVVPVGEVSKSFNGMIKLNATGEFLWAQLLKECTEADLVKAMVEQYEVTEEIAAEDVKAFVEILKKPGIVA